MLQCYFSLRQFRLIKCSFFIHSDTPYIHPRLDFRIEPKFSDWQSAPKLRIMGQQVTLKVDSKGP